VGPRVTVQEGTDRSRSLASGVLWNLAQFGAGRVVTFVVTALLARMLVPEDFGLLALGLLALGVFDRLKDIGVGAGLVQRPGPWSRLAPTGLTLSVGGAVLLAGACAVLAPQLATLLGDDELVAVLRALAISLAVSGLSVLPDAALRRRMLFRQRSLPELSGAVVKGAVSIALALAGLGVFSLVWGQVAGALTTTLGYWFVYRRQDFAPLRPGWDRAVAGSLLTYGSQLAWVSLLALLLDNLDYLVIGRRLGAEQLGYYTMAFRLPELLVISVCAVIGQVLFSSFSARSGDRDGLSRQFLSATGAIACLTVPVGVGLSAAAPDLVPAVLGEAFGPSVPVLQLLGLYAAVYSLTFHAGELYKATGKAHILVWLSLVKLVTFAPVLWFAAGHSVTAVAAAVLGLNVAFGLLRATIVRRQLGVGVAAQVRAVAAPIIAGAVLWGVVVWAGAHLPDWGHPVRLLVLAALGLPVYLGALLALDRSALSRLRELTPWTRA
jgi:PST family polysaccharide transporter